jgi:TonB-dependent receptor
MAYAQQGKVRGTITDGTYGDPLIGAFIHVVGVQNGTITDLDGQYTLPLDPGNYNIEISYEGFETVVLENVRVEADKVTEKNVTLYETSGDVLDAGTVTATRRTNNSNALIRAKQKSSIVFDGIATDQMTKQNESNAAGALKRVTGVSVEGGKYVYVRGLGDRYSKTTLNRNDVPSLDPERNSVQMDLFPSNIISNMQVYKTFSAELPGDFTGGLINIETRDFPSKFFLNFSTSFGSNSQVFLNDNFLTYQGSSTDWLGFDNGYRDIPDAVQNEETPYVLKYAGGDNQTLENHTKSFNKEMNLSTRTPGINQSYSLSFGNQKKVLNRPVGFWFGASYRRGFNFYEDGAVGRYNAVSSSILNPQYLLSDDQSTERVVTGLFGNVNVKLNKRNKIGLNLMRNQSGEKNARFLSGQWAEDGSVSPDAIFNSLTMQYLQRTLNTAQLKGEHEFENKYRFEWTTAYTISQQDEPDLRFMAYDYVIGSNGERVYDIQKNAYALPSRYFRKMDERNWDTKIYLTIPLEKLGDKANIKTGASLLTKQRTFRETRFDYFETDNFDGDIDGFFSDENMNLNPYPADNSSTYILTYEGDNMKNSYDGDQTIAAGFVQTDLPIIKDKLNLNAGLRVETTNILVNSLDVRQPEGRLENVDFLPAVNLNYLLKNDDVNQKFANLRAGYSRTLARPTFRELAPFPSFFFTGDFILLGNANLVRTQIQNIDIRYELFPKAGDYFSVSGFYKTFKNPIEKTQNPVAAATEITFKNVGDANLYGVEIELRKGLDFISPKVKDFQIGGNFSLIRSEVRIDSLEFAVRKEIDENALETRSMYNQSPYIINGFINYENDSSGTSFNISYNVFGKRLVLVSQGILPDIYEMPRPSLDVNVFQKIGDRFTSSLSVKNILNPATRFVHEYGGQEFEYSSFTRGIQFSVGLKYKI